MQKVARAGRFGTKGLAITFVSDETDAKVLNDVQERFEVNITELPEEIDLATYSKFYTTAFSLARADCFLTASSYDSFSVISRTAYSKFKTFAAITLQN